jgi:hypothetical protein
VRLPILPEALAAVKSVRTRLYGPVVPRKQTAPRTVWVAEVLVSEAIAEKIRSKHG